MRTSFFIIVAMMLLFICEIEAAADDIVFPVTEQEIVEALSIKDGKTEFQGVIYESEKGKVYKIIKGKRYQIRGLQSIVDSKIVPRAGALIHFDFDSATIRPESFALLDEYGKALNKGLAGASLIVAGHTDSRGTIEYNQKLSEARAQAVVIYLRHNHKISSERLYVKGYSATRPIADNDTAKGRLKNRRVEFIRIN